MSNDNGLIFKAWRFATLMHGDQLYGRQPYTYHLGQVVGILEQVGVTEEETMAAAWLHDVIEDTEATYEAVRIIGGYNVAEMVAACTASGSNRRERTKDCLRKMADPCTPMDGLLIKMADRCANMEYSKSHNQDLHSMYRQELPAFLEAIDRPQKMVGYSYILLYQRLLHPRGY